VKSIIYHEIIQVDDHEYVVFEMNYSEKINELIENNIIDDNINDITDYIVDDITNNAALQ
jgi:hypothetical protein